MTLAIERFVNLIKDNLFIFLLATTVIAIILMMSWWRLFRKTGYASWKAIVPVYNIWILLEIAKIPLWMIFLLFIPFVNFIGIPVMIILINWNVGYYCNKNWLFRICLVILPILFYPILAFTNFNYKSSNDLDIPELEDMSVINNGGNMHMEPLSIPDKVMDIVPDNDILIEESNYTPIDIVEEVFEPNDSNLVSLNVVEPTAMPVARVVKQEVETPVAPVIVEEKKEIIFDEPVVPLHNPTIELLESVKPEPVPEPEPPYDPSKNTVSRFIFGVQEELEEQNDTPDVVISPSTDQLMTDPTMIFQTGGNNLIRNIERETPSQNVSFSPEIICPRCKAKTPTKTGTCIVCGNKL